MTYSVFVSLSFEPFDLISISKNVGANLQPYFSKLKMHSERG